MCVVLLCLRDESKRVVITGIGMGRALRACGGVEPL